MGRNPFLYSSLLKAIVLISFLWLPPAALAAATGSVEGQVRDRSGKPVAGAQVELRPATQQAPLRTETDDQGGFRFPLVDAGSYALKVEAAGYFPTSYELTVRPRQAVVLTIEIAPRVAESQQVEVRAQYTDLDPGQTGSARILIKQELDELPWPARRDVTALAEIIAPGATLSHDNFIHFRGNELSLHQFINGVSFLDNPEVHFLPSLSPQIFDSVNFLSGGFAAEFGNRFGGVMDITTRSGRSMGGHGAVSAGLGTVLNRDLSADYGGARGRWGYYFSAETFESGRYLNPPIREELHDIGYGTNGTIQLDYQGEKNLFKLFLTGGGTNFELPNTDEEENEGRDATRRLRSQTAILNWQHVFSPRLLLATSVYERTVSDRLVGTSDPVTPYGDGSRSTLTTGVKGDLAYARRGHTVKTGVDLALFRLRESFTFDAREDMPNPEELTELFFRGRDVGGQFSFYVQDHFSPFRNFTVDAGVRWDQLNLVDSFAQVSPRLGVAYYIPRSRSVIHFAYNRLFTPPPLEWVILASFLGNSSSEEDERVGAAKPYRQHFFEVGWHQELHEKFFFEINAYAHRGRDGFENGEISNTRLFVPINFARTHARGLELTLGLRHLERLGLEARLQYALARVNSFGPITGGFAEEHLEESERIRPAFDQRHTGTATIFYRRPWRSLRAGFILRYGSGTPKEEHFEVNGEEMRTFETLPQHFTADFSTGVALWQREARRLDFEFNLTNLGNDVYQIAKESETTPVQFSARRTVSGRLTWRF